MTTAIILLTRWKVLLEKSYWLWDFTFYPNANVSVSHNAIVDVRRRHEIIFMETAWASNSKIFHHQPSIDSLYISTGNNVVTYFRSAANRINVFIVDHVLVSISQ